MELINMNEEVSVVKDLPIFNIISKSDISDNLSFVSEFSSNKKDL